MWDEENRIQEVSDNGHTKTYKYDDAGERVIKRGPQGETAYINQFFTMRNREVGTKHVFAGGTRLVSKLVKAPNVIDLDGDGIPDDIANGCSEPWGWTNGNGGQGNGNGPCNNNGNGGQNGNGGNNSTGPEVFEKDQYYYHPDHLGSSSYVTDVDGEIFQHLEYFPFGETWVEEHSNTQRTPYLFTAKELDEETGLYYFGARYYDPRTSVWQSPDPILKEYLKGTPNDGVFQPKTLSLYSYVMSNPVKYTDPNGLCVNDPLCTGNWGDPSGDFSRYQDPEGVQDSLNFGGGTAYRADPQVWAMDQQIDVGSQIQASIRGNGRMREAYDQAAASPGEEIPFVMDRIAMNSDPDAAIQTLAWPFGRVSGTATGTIVADGKGGYAVTATMTIDNDTYSWDQDGSSIWHNFGIGTLGNNRNGPGRQDMMLGVLSRSQLGWDSRISNAGIPRTRRGMRPPPGMVDWDSEPNGPLSVEYNRPYNFTGNGTVE